MGRHHLQINMCEIKIYEVAEKDLSKINDLEMLQTFNCGIGMIVIVDEKNISKTDKVLKKNRQPYKIIGQIINKPFKEKIIYVD